MKKIVQIAKYLPIVISTRDSIRKLFDLDDLKFFNEVVFDFSGIKFISRSAADELTKNADKCSINMSFINTNANIDSMFQAVWSKKKSREDTFAVTELTTHNELIQFFETL